MPCPAAMFLALVAVPALGGDPIVVDAAGGGDFTELQPAIDAAADGDVIVVLPGAYAAFALDRSLSILGPSAGPYPRVEGVSRITAPGGATLANLRLLAVTAEGVEGRLTIDNCTVAPFGDELPKETAFPDGLRLEQCAEVRLTACSLDSRLGFYGIEYAGLRAIESKVWVNGCEVQGFDWDDWPWTGYGTGEFYEDGGHGLSAVNSEVHIEASTLVGGGGTASSGGWVIWYGNGGDALRASGSTVTVRSRPGSGPAGDLLVAGHHGGSGYTGLMGVPLRLALDSHAWLSTPNFVFAHPMWPNVVDATSSLAVLGEHPVLERLGLGHPGGSYRLRQHAPVGALGVAVLAAPAAPYAVPGWDAALHVGMPFLILQPFVGEGLGDVVDVLVPVPASATLADAGLLVHAQSFFPLLPGLVDPSAADATGPVSLLLGF